jgi:hypothetical protein
MINVIKSLSDGELVAITGELANKSIKLESIVDQLVAKANGPFIVPDNRWDLVEVVLKEWVNRFKEDIQLNSLLK